MTKITPEIRRAIKEAAGEPARVEDPDSHEVYILIKEEAYKLLCDSQDIDHSDLSLQEYEDFQPIQ